MSGTPCSRASRSRLGGEPVVAQRVDWSGIRKGATNVNSSAEADEDRRRRESTTARRSGRASAITITIAAQTNRNTPPSAKKLLTAHSR